MKVFVPRKETGSRDTSVAMPDYASLAKELAKQGVTMQLLWKEYVDQCNNS